MKIMNLLKIPALLALVLTVAVGCASAPQAKPAVTQADAVEAINAAKAAIAEAKSEGYLWRDTESVLADAEKAYQAGDYAKAVELANKARRQAEDAIAQGRAEKERLSKQMAEQPGNYTVMRGDSLWRISGKSEIYGNPYKWPLIYKANSSKIKDADLIYPGQTFDINRNTSADEEAAAIHHAKTRGAWSLGTVEASDKAYLAH